MHSGAHGLDFLVTLQFSQESSQITLTAAQEDCCNRSISIKFQEDRGEKQFVGLGQGILLPTSI